MTGIIDALKSERGTILLGLLIGSVVLAALGHMTIEQWTDYTKWLFGAYAISKGATGVAALISSSKVETAKAELAADTGRSSAVAQMSEAITKFTTAKAAVAATEPSVIVDPAK